MIYPNLLAICRSYTLYVHLRIYIHKLYMILINPKKNPNIVSKLPIPVYLIALLIPLLISKTKKITIMNIVIPRLTSRTYSLSIISLDKV